MRWNSRHFIMPSTFIIKLKKERRVFMGICVRKLCACMQQHEEFSRTRIIDKSCFCFEEGLDAFRGSDMCLCFMILLEIFVNDEQSLKDQREMHRRKNRDAKSARKIENIFRDVGLWSFGTFTHSYSHLLLQSLQISFAGVNDSKCSGLLQYYNTVL